MRLLIDLQSLQSPASALRGVGRYTNNLVAALLAENRGHEVILAANAAFPETLDALRENFRGHVPPRNFRVWHQNFDPQAGGSRRADLEHVARVLRERFFNMQAPDYVFSTNLQEGLGDPATTGVKSTFVQYQFVTTLHDVVPLAYPHYLHDDQTRRWYNDKLSGAARSDILLTVSETSRKEIAQRLRLPLARIFVVPNAVDRTVFNPDKPSREAVSALRQKYNLPEAYVLYYGGADPHKNLEVLVEAFASGLVPRTSLVLAGSHAQDNRALRDLIASSTVPDRIFVIGYVPDDDLPTLIKTSSGVVLPSVHEGFGLPALEAMACGVPALGSQGTSMAEVINNDNATFDPTSPRSLADRIMALVTDHGFREALAAQALLTSAKYSWAHSAQTLWNVLEANFKDVPAFSTQKKIRRAYGGSAGRGELHDFVSEVRPLLNGMPGTALTAIAVSAAETFSWRPRPKVFLDISTIVVHDYRSGIQRVVRALATALVETGWNGESVELVYGRPGASGIFGAADYLTTGKAPEHDAEVEFCPGDMLIHLDLHPGLAISRAALLRHLRRKQVMVCFVVYDILPHLRPQMFWPDLVQEFERWLQEVSAADVAICISRTVALELAGYIERFGVRRERDIRVEWFHLGYDIQNSRPTTGSTAEIDRILETIGERQSFLMVGTLEPRKGHRQVLEAFDILWGNGTDVDLLLLGREGWSVEDLAYDLRTHPEAGRRLHWIPNASDAALEEFYKKASCLIVASEAEGFGLPLIEASARDLPIIARDIAVFREVAGEHAIYFPDSRDPQALASTVATWLREMAAGRRVGSGAMPRLTWVESAAEFVKAISAGMRGIHLRGKGELTAGSMEPATSERVIWQGFSPPGRSIGRRGTIAFASPAIDRGTQIRVTVDAAAQGTVRVDLDGAMRLTERVLAGPSVLVGSLESLSSGEHRLDLTWESVEGATVSVLEVGVGSNAAPLVLGRTYGHKSNELEWLGFSPPEDTFRWSVARRCGICFNIAESLSGEAVIQCDVLGFESQRVSLRLNGHVVRECVVEARVTIEVGGLSLARGLNYLEFIVPDSISPLGDPRLLAVGIYSFTVSARRRGGE